MREIRWGRESEGRSGGGGRVREIRWGRESEGE